MDARRSGRSELRSSCSRVHVRTTLPARKNESGGVRAPSARRCACVMTESPTWYDELVQPKPSRGMRWKSVP